MPNHDIEYSVSYYKVPRCKWVKLVRKSGPYTSLAAAQGRQARLEEKHPELRTRVTRKVRA